MMETSKRKMEDKKGESKGWMRAADQRKTLVYLTLPLKKSQENRLGFCCLLGEHTHTHANAHTCTH